MVNPEDRFSHVEAHMVSHVYVLSGDILWGLEKSQHHASLLYGFSTVCFFII